MKKSVRYILLTFVAGALCYWAWGKFSGHAPPAVSASHPLTTTKEPSLQMKPAVVVTYFTTNVRCESCRTIETLARATVEESFAQELAASIIRFQTINLDEPANKHFAEDYDMAFKTVVVSEEAAGRVLRWTKLDDVWSLLGKPEEFKAYLARPIHAYLEKRHD